LSKEKKGRKGGGKGGEDYSIRSKSLSHQKEGDTAKSEREKRKKKGERKGKKKGGGRGGEDASMSILLGAICTLDRKGIQQWLEKKELGSRRGEKKGEEREGGGRGDS